MLEAHHIIFYCSVIYNIWWQGSIADGFQKANDCDNQVSSMQATLKAVFIIIIILILIIDCS